MGSGKFSKGDKALVKYEGKYSGRTVVIVERIYRGSGRQVKKKYRVRVQNTRYYMTRLESQLTAIGEDSKKHSPAPAVKIPQPEPSTWERFLNLFRKLIFSFRCQR